MMLVHIVTCIGRKANGFAIDSDGERDDGELQRAIACVE